MLGYTFLTFRFFRFVQCGFYIDFILKKFTEMFVRNFFVYASTFFGEKFYIEYLTKKIIDSYVFESNRNYFTYSFGFSAFFTQVTSFILYTIIFINLVVILF